MLPFHWWCCRHSEHQKDTSARRVCKWYAAKLIASPKMYSLSDVGRVHRLITHVLNQTIIPLLPLVLQSSDNPVERQPCRNTAINLDYNQPWKTKLSFLCDPHPGTCIFKFPITSALHVLVQKGIPERMVCFCNAEGGFTLIYSTLSTWCMCGWWNDQFRIPRRACFAVLRLIIINVVGCSSIKTYHISITYA